LKKKKKKKKKVMYFGRRTPRSWWNPLFRIALKWKKHVPMKCWYLLLTLHGVTSQNTVISTATTVRASRGFTNFAFSVKFLVFKSVSIEQATRVLIFLICVREMAGLYIGGNNNCID
jgi:glucan phosphoethanolaminetransferase (alkaline phosphatase superfamily)